MLFVLFIHFLLFIVQLLAELENMRLAGIFSPHTLLFFLNHISNLLENMLDIAARVIAAHEPHNSETPVQACLKGPITSFRFHVNY